MSRFFKKKSTDTIIDEKLTEFRGEIQGEIRRIASDEAKEVQERINRDLDNFKQEIENKLAIKTAMRPLESREQISLNLNPRSDSISDSISESSSSLGLSNDPPSVITSPSSSSESTSNMFSVTFDDEPTSSQQTNTPDSNVHNPFGTPLESSPEKIGFSDNFGTEQDKNVGAKWISGLGSQKGPIVNNPNIYKFTGSNKHSTRREPRRRFLNRRHTQRTGNPLVRSNPNVGPYMGKFAESFGKGVDSTIKSEDDVKTLYNDPSNWRGGRKTKKRRRHKKKTNKKGQYKKIASRRRRNTRKK